MANIWAKRLVAGTQEWSRVPSMWRSQVRDILIGWVNDNTLTRERFTEITGEDFSE